MTQQETQEQTWNRNNWLKDAKGLPIESDGIHQSLKEYYDACWHDLTSARQSSYPPEWILQNWKRRLMKLARSFYTVFQFQNRSLK